jgi:hypothetical protein
MAGPPRPQRTESPAAGVTGRNLSGTNLERAGDHTQRVRSHALRVGGPVTRSDLALTTGLTAASNAAH